MSVDQICAQSPKIEVHAFSLEFIERISQKPSYELESSQRAAELFAKYESMPAATWRFVKYCFGVESKVHTRPDTLLRTYETGEIYRI